MTRVANVTAVRARPLHSAQEQCVQMRGRTRTGARRLLSHATYLPTHSFPAPLQASLIDRLIGDRMSRKKHCLLGALSSARVDSSLTSLTSSDTKYQVATKVTHCQAAAPCTFARCFPSAHFPILHSSLHLSRAAPSPLLSCVRRRSTRRHIWTWIGVSEGIMRLRNTRG